MFDGRGEILIELVPGEGHLISGLVPEFQGKQFCGVPITVGKTEFEEEGDDLYIGFLLSIPAYVIWRTFKLGMDDLSQRIYDALVRKIRELFQRNDERANLCLRVQLHPNAEAASIWIDPHGIDSSSICSFLDAVLGEFGKSLYQLEFPGFEPEEVHVLWDCSSEKILKIVAACTAPWCVEYYTYDAQRQDWRKVKLDKPTAVSALLLPSE